MRIVVSVLAILFGLLHLAAAATRFKAEDPAVRASAIIMACGCVSVFASSITHLIGAGWITCLELLVGCTLVCAAAWLNGKLSKDFHLSHHAVRGGIAALLVICFTIW